MLRAYVISSKGLWEKWLPLAEFSYNSYQASIKMAPFEALYGQKCRTPLNWIEPSERRYFGIDLVTKAEEQVRIIQQHMKAAQSRQKSYTDKRRRPLPPMKGVQRFGVKRKLAPRYVGPYKISEHKGNAAYKLQLPPEMSAIFDVFMFPS